MSVLDHAQVTSDWQVDVLATDINEEILERARAARFSQLEVNRGLPASLLVRHFERCETEWRVLPAVRGMVRFKNVNLADSFADLPAMDVVFLRNVLIYFDRVTQEKLFQRFYDALAPGGFLVLGKVETLLGPTRTLFSAVDPRERIFRRR